MDLLDNRDRAALELGFESIEALEEYCFWHPEIEAGYDEAMVRTITMEHVSGDLFDASVEYGDMHIYDLLEEGHR